MPPKTSAKTKAQELQRIRNNQQRSRDRRRAYLSELEEKIHHLSEKLELYERSKDRESTTSNAVLENDARRELLKSLGIDENAQQQFVRAFSKRTAKRRTAGMFDAEISEDVSGLPSSPPGCDEPAATTTLPQSKADQTDALSARNHSTRYAYSIDDEKSGRSCSHSYLEPRCLSARGSVSDVSVSETLDTQTPSTLEPGASQPWQPAALRAFATSSIEQEALWVPCWSNITQQTSTPCPENTTGCSIAFSMLLLNNNRGYSHADIDARLQSAYRRDDTVAEGCSVLNKAMFQLLSEIS